MSRLYYYFSDYWENEQDLRTKHLIGIESIGPLTILLFITSYIIFAKKIGPTFMKNKQPFNETHPKLIFTIMFVYNICKHTI